MAKKNRATFAKREKERARLSKQAEKRAKRQQTPDPNAAADPRTDAVDAGLHRRRSRRPRLEPRRRREASSSAVERASRTPVAMGTARADPT